MTQTINIPQSRDFNTELLPENGRQLADFIVKKIGDWAGPDASGGGCKAFYSAKQWNALNNGEQVDGDVVLVVCYDGGTLRNYFSKYAEYSQMREKMADTLAKGYYRIEHLTGWCCAIYRDLKPQGEPKKLTPKQFQNVMLTAIRANHYQGERLGQAIFNATLEVNPGLANRLRGTGADCFHQDSKIKDFLGYITDSNE